MADSRQRHSLEKDILYKSLSYSLSLYVRIFFKLLSGVLVAKFLGPSLFGLRNAFDLSLGYESYSDLGTYSALNREAPYYRGEKDLHKYSTAISSIFTVNVIYATSAALLLIAVSQYLRVNEYDGRYVDFVLFLGIMIFTGKINTFLQVRLKIDNNFYLLSKITVLYALAASILGVLLTYWLSFRGFLMSLLLAESLCICTMLLSAEQSIPKLKMSLSIYLKMLRIGFPMMILFLLLMLLGSADRIMVLGLISEKALGYYGIASVAATIIVTIPDAIHNVTLVPVMEKLGKTNDRNSIKSYFIEPMTLLAYLMPILVGCLQFGIHLPITHYLDKYTESISVVKILVTGAYFQAIASPALSICLAFNRQRILISLVLPLVVFGFGLNYLFIKGAWGVNGAAIASSLTFFCYFFVLVHFALRQFNEPFTEVLKTVWVLLTPCLYSAILILAIDTFLDIQCTDLWSDIVFTVSRMCLFVLLYSLILVKIRNHRGFVRFLDNLVLVRFFGDKLKRGAVIGR